MWNNALSVSDHKIMLKKSRLKKKLKVPYEYFYEYLLYYNHLQKFQTLHKSLMWNLEQQKQTNILVSKYHWHSERKSTYAQQPHCVWTFTSHAWSIGYWPVKSIYEFLGVMLLVCQLPDIQYSRTMKRYGWKAGTK